MNKYIALTGPIGSGKTTLAQALCSQGYMLISFTNMLKQLLSDSLAPLVTLTVDDINKNKREYRTLLQEFGRVINFDGDPDYVHAALDEWVKHNKPPAVFDNPRSEAQARILKLYGFSIVRLETCSISADLATRAQVLHPIEQGIPGHLIDLRIQAHQDLRDMINQILKA